ncbi:MAG: recombinase family protein, partial [Bacteroidota bacterium]
MNNKKMHKREMKTAEVKNSAVWNQFAKQTGVSKERTDNCIIYTRVSTKEQESGYSLDAQRKECEEYALKAGYNIQGYFGGTYESAKTDERKEFNRMLSFAKKSKERITYIIVHMLDRFSRSGANAIYIKEQLKEQGIYIQSVRQPVDTSTSSGDFQQNIQMIFSHYDNQVRKEKCMSGIKEALLKGEWVTKPPMGYDVVYSDGVKKIVLNEKGRLIKKAFHWKAEGQSAVEIIEKLKKYGFDLYPQQMSRIFRNPFYCGMLSHTVLEGKLVKGNQEECVSEEIFLKANEVLDKLPHGYVHMRATEPIPLKNYVKCGHCGSNMPGYLNRKKGLWYYKCRVKGCCNNKSAIRLHEKFMEIMDLMTINSEYRQRLKGIIADKITALQEEKIDVEKSLLAQLKEAQARLEQLEERHAYGEISKEIYGKFSVKLKEEVEKISNQLQECRKKVSNPEGLAERMLNYAKNLREVWDLCDYNEKFKMQNILFPAGITYNKKTDNCRPIACDQSLGWMARKQGEIQVKEKGESPLFLVNSPLVA